MGFKKIIQGTKHELFGSGRLDGAAANELEIEVLAAERAGATEIYINLAEASWICSAGIRVLLQYHRKMKLAGKKLVVTHPSTTIEEILGMTGFRQAVVERARPAA